MELTNLKKRGCWLFVLALIFTFFYTSIFDGSNYVGTSDDFLSLMPTDVSLWERFWRGYSTANGRVGALIVFAFCNIPSKIFALSPFDIPWRLLYGLNFLLMGLGLASAYLVISAFLKRKINVFDYLFFTFLYFLILGCPWVLRDYFRWHVMLQDYSIPFFLLFFTFFFYTIKKDFPEKNKINFALISLGVFFSASSNETFLGVWGVLIPLILIYGNRILHYSYKEMWGKCLPFIVGYIPAFLGFVFSPGQWKRKAITTTVPFNKENFLIPFIYNPSKMALGLFTYDGDIASKKYFIIPGILALLIPYYFFFPKKLNRYLALFGVLQIVAFAASWTRLFSFYFPQRTSFFSGSLYILSYLVLCLWMIDFFKEKKKQNRFLRTATFLSLFTVLVLFVNYRIGDGLAMLSKLSARGKLRSDIFQVVDSFKERSNKENQNIYYHNCPEELEAIWGVINFKKWQGIESGFLSIVIDDVNYDRYGIRNYVGLIDDFSQKYSREELTKIGNGPPLPLNFSNYQVFQCKKNYPKFHRRISDGQVFPVIEFVDYKEKSPQLTFEYIIDQVEGNCHFSLLKEEVYNSVPVMEELVGADIVINIESQLFSINVTKRRDDMEKSKFNSSLVLGESEITNFPPNYKKAEELLFPKVFKVTDDRLFLRLTIDNVITDKPLYILSSKLTCKG